MAAGGRTGLGFVVFLTGLIAASAAGKYVFVLEICRFLASE